MNLTITVRMMISLAFLCVYNIDAVWAQSSSYRTFAELFDLMEASKTHYEIRSLTEDEQKTIG